MAKKKLPSIEDAVLMFKDVMRRASLTDYRHVNGVAVSKNPNGVSVMIVPDKTLWAKLLEDEELRDHIKELNISNPDDQKLQDIFTYANIVNEDGWFDIDGTVLYSGKIINIKIDGYNYEVTINKTSIPIKLKKSEFTNITYKVVSKPRTVLILKKVFDGPVEDSSFTVLRMFHVI